MLLFGMETAANLLAQTAPPMTNSGGAAGWTAAGLLVAMLAWLCYVHLPGQIKLIRDMTDAHTARLERLGEQHLAAIDKVIAANEKSLERILEHCKGLKPT